MSKLADICGIARDPENLKDILEALQWEECLIMQHGNYTPALSDRMDYWKLTEEEKLECAIKLFNEKK